MMICSKDISNGPSDMCMNQMKRLYETNIQ